MLNGLIEKQQQLDVSSLDVSSLLEEGAEFPATVLPEDFAMRGFSWVERYYPEGWFGADIETENKDWVQPSMTMTRVARVSWLGARITETMEGGEEKWLRFDLETRMFGGQVARL
ncbi:hypothetical protein C8A01DRAFT_19922 [Parachaetomium inaequale]|uniref:Uncharacterized protein n=1 Tax=Parachaetomium inaequale TaxID=2588326 RepID=A0AAN6SMV5_9PEZI|nr:hypothetical protein C8A01DRAFT_19922 [Parachaetomium inaequale]